MSVVIIVEDHTLVRQGLRAVVEATGQFDTCIECASLSAALVEVKQAGDALSLLLLDMGLPDASGSFALDELKQLCPKVPVLVVSGTVDAQSIDSAFAKGARGYVPKNSSATAFRAAIEMVMNGEMYVPPHVLPSQGSDAPPVAVQQPSSGQARLTRRQSDVLVMMAKGLQNKEIAQALDMSPSTVRAHVTAILKALGVENRTQAATSPTAQVLLGSRG